MKLPLERHIYFVFAIVFSMLVGMQCFFYKKTTDLHTALKVRGHSNEMLKTLKSLLSVLYEAESQKRGYVITNDKAFKDAFREALNRLKRVQSELENLGDDAPEFQGGFQQLASGLSARVESLSNILSQPHAEVARAAPTETKKGRMITDAVEAMFAKIEMDMQERWSESNFVVEKDFQALVHWGGATIFLSALIMLVACLYIHRDFKELADLLDRGSRDLQRDRDYEDITGSHDLPVKPEKPADNILPLRRR